jgi:Fur family transcriptional regulator, ferric uptake regulator
MGVLLFDGTTMNELDAVLDCVRSQGERITIPRRLVIEALCSTTNHLSINDLQTILHQRDPDLSLSDTTIYRVLQWLKELEIVSQTDMGQAGIVYALITQPSHHHLICLNCGAIITVEDAIFAPLREQLQRQYGFEARIDHMAIYGHCSQCLRDAGS